MSTEYPETIYYYAMRDTGSYLPDPRRNVPASLVKEWHIVFLIQSFTVRPNGTFYIPDKKGIDQRYYIHHIPFSDYDMLDAFGVPAVTGFEIKYWKTRDGLVLP